ncbi:MAG: glucosamine-6-phosphate deaminase [Bacteroidota bacterium]|nr:glucosamine-6-phosphate deaminase [Bacteroidota bacterium]MDP4273567.1 glucosamine-6-phosphate deaminase [Bacteroidota bacterium]
METKFSSGEMPDIMQIEADKGMRTKTEKIPVKIFSDHNDIADAVTNEIATAIIESQKQGKNFVLGLATGSTPTTVYTRLVNLCREGKLSFKNVITFNLDEYYPMDPSSLQSYVRFMKEYLFDHIDIKPENVHIPDGTVPREKLQEFCQHYDEMIEQAGGVDLQILGIGRSGHIGFNEPGSEINSPTRLISLDHMTIVDAASDFYGEDYVPRRALTMGIGTILKARRILLLALGEGKSAIIKRAIEDPVSNNVPASYLQTHPNTLMILDDASSAELTRVKTPWLVDSCDWENTKLIRLAVGWLCQKLNKPILRLTDRDYSENGMSELIAVKGPSNKINIQVFNDLQHTITGWPGGKPNADDTYRPERALPYPKRVLIFSPHPDDDVISMGGTLIRLVEQGHEVYTAYQTTGCIAVHDDDVFRYLDFATEFDETVDVNTEKIDELYSQVKKFVESKKPGESDTPEVQNIKTIIRRGEAKAACRFMGIPIEHVHFLNMPFYETGKVVKKPLGQQDIDLIVKLLKEIQPHQIYAAGDLSDPHGTHRVCFEAITRALKILKDEPWLKNCNIWMYRGAWQEWNIGDIDMAVPISPDELMMKRKAIFKHQSQKDKALFPGFDEREFWQRAEDRNKATAKLYNQVGMAEYEAIEAFVKYKK